MEKQIIYPDSSLILNVFWDDRRGERARAILEDPLHCFMMSDYVWLETLPKMLYNKQFDQVSYMERIFSHAEFIPASGAIIAKAKELAARYGLAGMDALHIASALEGGADEFITFEKPAKPFFRIPPEVLRITSLYETP
ncbi:MAG: PIN domain-containing protein [Treponema sp.]|jgi:predicted nucleic acid-binding protein|nr:PIN domain-containing protein [Treponema sp.]